MRSGFTVNLGAGHGYSVLKIVCAFEAVSGRQAPHDMVSLRSADIGVCYANPRAAKALLNWQAQKGLAEMCADRWRWQSMNPQGFQSADAVAK